MSCLSIKVTAEFAIVCGLNHCVNKKNLFIGEDDCKNERFIGVKQRKVTLKITK